MKFYLVKNDLPKFEIDVTNITDGLDEGTKVAVDFNIYQACSWDSEDNSIYEKNFISEVYFKWDYCTHWRFHGMDYNPSDIESETDSYYHICGSSSITDWMIMFAFVRKVMYEILGDTTNEYSEMDKILDTQLLVGHKIVKEE